VFTRGGTYWIEYFLRPAEAADPTQLAETAGFLLGNAHRCGVPAERVDHAGKVVHHLIVAAF
jgi:hypothetical protein